MSLDDRLRNRETRVEVVQPKIEVVSNANPHYLEKRLKELERVRQAHDFLKGAKRVVLIDNNRAYLYEIGGRIMTALGIEHEAVIMPSENAGIHNLVDEANVVYGINKNPDEDIVMIYGRQKSLASQIEKISRNNGSKTTRDLLDAYGKPINDDKGITIVTKDESGLYRAMDKILSLGFLRELNKQDFLQTPKITSGGREYKGIHVDALEMNGNQKLNGMHVEIHGETIRDMMYNKSGGLLWAATHPKVWEALMQYHPELTTEIARTMPRFNGSKLIHNDYGQTKLVIPHSIPEGTVIVGMDNKVLINDQEPLFKVNGFGIYEMQTEFTPCYVVQELTHS